MEKKEEKKRWSRRRKCIEGIDVCRVEKIGSEQTVLGRRIIYG